MFCHYFNNDKDCPYDTDDEDGCIYLHDDSQPCKFGSGCERQLCMFKHKKRDDAKEYESSNFESDEEDVENDTESVSEMIPILEKFKKTVDKFDILLQKCSSKCKLCDFETKDSNGLIMHMKAKHKQ